MKMLFFLIIFVRVKIKKVVLVSYAILRNKITRYPQFVVRFENNFAKMTSSQFALSFCNGTSSIEAALFAIGIKEGDEVIVPSCTFHASIDPICNVGAKPIFADVDRKNLTLCPIDVQNKITNKTKAIMVVHLFGIPADMKAFELIAKTTGIDLIEDTSHAHGAIAAGKICGSFGRVGAFSLQGAKAIAAGEGGIAVTNNKDDFTKMSAWGHFTRHAHDFADVQLQDFKYTGVGYKRRMAPLSAILAQVDLCEIERINKLMNQTTKQLDIEFSKVKGLVVPQLPLNSQRGGFYCGYPFSLEKHLNCKDEIVEALNKMGIKASPYPFELHHQLKVYNDLSYRKKRLNFEPRQDAGEFSKTILINTEELQSRLILIGRQHLITLTKSKINQMTKKINQIIQSTQAGV